MGSPAASAASLDKFSGVNFDDWDYKLKAICFQQGLGDILLHPDEWQQTVAALQRRVDSRTSAMSTRSSSSASPDADTGSQDVTALKAERTKSTLLTSILVNKITDKISKILREHLPESELFNPIAIYRFLRANYATSPGAQVEENAETSLLVLLSQTWSQGSFFDYVRRTQQKLSSILMQRKLQNESAQRVLVSLTIKHILDQIKLRKNSIFEPVLLEFMPRILADRELPLLDTLQALVNSVERIHLLHPPMSDRARERKKKDDVAGPPPGAPHRSSAGPSSDSGGGSGQRGRGGKKGKRKQHGQPSVSVSTAVADDEVDSDTLTAAPSAPNTDAVNVSFYAVSVSVPRTLQHKNTKFILVDSGATNHCVREKALFSTFRPGKHVVRVANNQTVTAFGKGDVVLEVITTAGKTMKITLTDVYFCPSFATNILSTHQFLSKDPDNNSVMMSASQKVLRTSVGDIALHTEHKLMWLAATKVKSSAVPVASSAAAPSLSPVQTMTMRLFHERMGHINIRLEGLCSPCSPTIYQTDGDSRFCV